MNNKIEEAKKYWLALEDIAVNDDDEILTDFDIFEKGTDKVEILYYLEERFNVSIARDLFGLE